MRTRNRALPFRALATSIVFASLFAQAAPSAGLDAATAATPGQLYCPPGATADVTLGYCFDGASAYGPFTKGMTDACTRWGGGPACTQTLAFSIDGRAVNVARWSRGFARLLRGDGDCMNGASRDRVHSEVCVEEADASASGVREAYGPFPRYVVVACIAIGGGDACYTNRWSYAFYASLAAGASAPNFGASRTLEYHGVATGPAASLPPGMFVSTGHLSNLAARYSNANHLVIFDDGYRHVFELAFPILRARRVPAVAAIIVDATRDSGAPDANREHMSRAELTALAAAGWSLAFHADTFAEHELNYRRMSEALATGAFTDAKNVPILLASPDALDWLTATTGGGRAAAGRLLAKLTELRAEVTRRTRAGQTTDDAVTDVLAALFERSRRALATIAAVPVEAVDTIVYPHSESDARVRTAAARAGFVRGYAGGPIGNANDPFELPRVWMNDTTPLP
jgi:hypothetical protein